MTDHDTRVAAILAAVEAYYEHPYLDENASAHIDRVVNSFDPPPRYYQDRLWFTSEAPPACSTITVPVEQVTPGHWVEIQPQTFQWFHLPTARQQLEREAKSRPPLEPPKPHHATLNDQHRRRRK